MGTLLDCLTVVCLFMLVFYLCLCLSPEHVTACAAPLVLPALYFGDGIGLGGGCVSARSSPELTLDFTCAGGRDCKLASAAAATDRAVAAERVMIPFHRIIES